MPVDRTKQPCETCGVPFGIGDWPLCPHGVPHWGTNIAPIHKQERAVVFRNPMTGEVKMPASSNEDMPATYRREGYVREELETMRDIRQLERQTGMVHENSHFDSKTNSSASSPANVIARDLKKKPFKADPKFIDKLANDLRG